jgi:hypothetical protein
VESHINCKARISVRSNIRNVKPYSNALYWSPSISLPLKKKLYIFMISYIQILFEQIREIISKGKRSVCDNLFVKHNLQLSDKSNNVNYS